MKRLIHELLKVPCRPYYIYSCDLSEGLRHFRSSVETGVSIIEALRGHTTGFGVPTFVVDTPGAGGKLPISPEYLVSKMNEVYLLRNHEGKTFQ